MMHLVMSKVHSMLTSIGLHVFNQPNFLNELTLSLKKRFESGSRHATIITNIRL